MEVDPSSSSTNPNTPASDFLRGKAKALDALHRKIKAAPGDNDVLITASTEMGMIFDRFIKGHADENAIAFNSASEATPTSRLSASWAVTRAASSRPLWSVLSATPPLNN